MSFLMGTFIIQSPCCLCDFFRYSIYIYMVIIWIDTRVSQSKREQTNEDLWLKVSENGKRRMKQKEEE